MEKNQLPNVATETNSESQKLSPREMIAEIFEASDLEFMRLELWNLLKAVTTNAPWSFMGDPSMVLYIRDQMITMMTACKQLLEAEEATNEMQLDTFANYSEEQNQADRQYVRNLTEVNETYNGLIQRLSLSETERPLLAVKRFFTAYSFNQWTFILTQWTEYALSKMSICEATGECLEVEQYELLECLLEAVYLIREQDEITPRRRKKVKKASGLSAITELIIAALEPEMIFQVSHANITSNTTKGYTDLLIVIPDNNTTPFHDLEPLVELITAQDQTLCCSLHKSSAIHQALNDGHIYYSLACLSENLVYQSTTAKIPVLPNEKFSAIVAKARQEFEIGMVKAHAFYLGAERYAADNDSAMAMFMLQQATELTFRAVALSMYGVERRTHSIKSLKKLNRRLAPQLNDIFPADTEEEERLLKLLEDAYLDARYSVGYIVREDDLRTLLSRIGQLIEIGSDIFNARGINVIVT